MPADSVVTLPSEFALVYRTMSHDRAFLAGFVTCLISKLLSLGTPAEDRDLSELVLGTLLSSDADRSRGPVVRTDSKKSDIRSFSHIVLLLICVCRAVLSTFCVWFLDSLRTVP